VQLAHLEDVKSVSLLGPQAPRTARNVNHVRKLTRLTIHPPDPVIAAKPHDVAAWYKTKLFTCAPFDIDSSFLPFCPRCNSTEYWHRGWSGFRRVVDVDQVCHAVTRRYLCKNDSCAVEYLGWDQDILARAPAHIRATFPVILTHRLAVTEAVFELMRSCLDAGTGPGPFAKMIEEHHRRRYDRCRLSYLARVSALRHPPQSGQTSMHARELNQEPPVFSAFDDPEGYGGIRVSARYLRSVYTFCMGVLEGHMKRKNAKVSARILSGDHFFKILRCNFTFGGSRSFEAAYSLVNEHSEVVAVVLTQSKTLEEIRAMLIGVAKRMVALGHAKDHITLFYTDNPVAEKNFLLSIFDGLHRGAPVPPPLPLISLPADHVVNLVTLHSEVNSYVRLLRDDMEGAVRAGKPCVIGLDTEWTVSGRGKRRRSAPTQVLQLSTAKRTLVVHLARTGMTHELKALLCDEDVLKVGRGIALDVSRLQQQWPSMSVLNVKDVGSFGKEHGLVPRANMSLTSLCEQLLGVSLDKTEQLGHWGGDLSNSQVMYAAKDSYSSWALYHKMLSYGSCLIDPDQLTPNASVIVMDASRTEPVAYATIAAVQPSPSARRVAKSKKGVLVNVEKVLVPAFVLPLARSSEETTLGALWHNAELGGPRAAFVVPCRQLRDAKHPLGLGVVREHVERPRVPTIGSDGVFDACAEVTLDARRLQDMVSATGATSWGDEEDEDTDGEGALDGALGEEGDLPELDVELADAADWEASGVKADPMHVMDRVLRVIPKGHGAVGLFSRRFSQAMMLSNLKDALAAKAAAAKLWPNTPWPEILFRRSRWLNKRVRRLIPAPDILVPRLKAVFAEFENIVDATTGSPLFTPLSIKAFKAVLRLAECGAVSDDPETPLYSLLALDKDQLPLWLCSRGTNVNEGGVHQKLVKNFLSMKGASPELVYFALLEWVHRNNVRAAARNRGVHFPGHYDTWIVDALCKLEEELYGRRVSFPSWQCADDYSLPDFCCGVMPMEKSTMDKLGLPVGDMLKKARTLLPRVSSQKRWLARAMGSELPLLPVHTVEDIQLYHKAHKRLVEVEEQHRKSAAPGDEAVVITADCEPSVEELTVAINKAVTLQWMRAVNADDDTVPAVFFKTFDHVRMYQSRFEKSRNMMSTLVVHGPSLRRDIVAAGESYLRFGAPAVAKDAVHPMQTVGAAAGPTVTGGGAAAGPTGTGGGAAEQLVGGRSAAAAGSSGCEDGSAFRRSDDVGAATAGPAGGAGGADSRPAGRQVGAMGSHTLDAPVGQAGGGADGAHDAGRAADEGIHEDAAADASEDVLPPGAAVLPRLGGQRRAPVARHHPDALFSGLPTSAAALLYRGDDASPLLAPPSTTIPLLGLGLAGRPNAGAGLQMGGPNTFLLQMLAAPAARAATTATSTVAPLVGHSTASWVASTGPAAAAFVPSLSSSARDVGAMDPGPDSATSAYVAVPRRPKAARHCRRCRSVLCPGRSRLTRCVSESGTAAADAHGAALQSLPSGSSSAPPSSAPDGSGSTSSSAGEREPPRKAPKNR